MSDVPRIAWLSPYGPRSDVGAFTRCILPHFVKDDALRVDCDLFINQCGPSYDAAILNLGNNVENHGDIVNILRRVPAIAVLHDFSYHHFFAYKCFEELKS